MCYWREDKSFESQLIGRDINLEMRDGIIELWGYEEVRNREQYRGNYGSISC